MRVPRYLILLIFLFFIIQNTQAQIDTTLHANKKTDTINLSVIRPDTSTLHKTKPDTSIIHLIKPIIKTEPKREFRGVWVATVANIDWPSQGNFSPDRQKQELINILDADQKIGINAIILQVRPAADALYAKGSEPWSKWLTGKQGQAPIPFYDPLEFAITEAHKRGMELHAWFNPYRATFDSNFRSLSPNHITNLQPSWFLTYGGIKLFNPGIPEVREYIVKTILNVVDNYDIDGVHMDDYFYPYKIDGQKIKDEQTFKTYGGDFTNIDDWRRNNVDLLIKMLSDSIHEHNPDIKFGISPFGIWKNASRDPEGSLTHGGDSFYELYADTRKWVKEGWVDYVAPQIYWNFGYHLAPFENLVDWWSNNTYGHHLYIGQAPYRAFEQKSKPFKNPSELPNQVRYLRDNPRVQGSIYFSQNSLLRNPIGFTDSLKTNFYKYPALPPVMLWLDSIPPNIPQNFSAKVNGSVVSLTWQTPLLARDEEPVYGYVIYRFNDQDKINLDDPKYILHIQYDASTTFDDQTAQQGKTYLYVITAIDRLKNESDRSPAIAVTLK